MEERTIVRGNSKQEIITQYGDGYEENVTAQEEEQPFIEPTKYDYTNGYVGGDTWYPGEQNPKCYSDVYPVEANKKYRASLGAVVGTRFRVIFTTRIPGSTQYDPIRGIQIAAVNNPSPYASAVYTTSESGYITIGKDNAGQSGLESFLQRIY